MNKADEFSSVRNLLMQGATGDRLCWYPRPHRLHVRPVTPSLHEHWPVVWLHDWSRAPTGWQSHATQTTQHII